MKKPHKPSASAVLIKHKAAIHVSNDVPLAARMVYNYLLWRAYDRLPHDEYHGVALAEVLDGIGMSTNNTDYVKGLLDTLAGTRLQWNVLGRDGEEEWGVMTLLAEAVLKGGTITYVFPPTLRKRLYNPSTYAKLSLVVQTEFSSKYGLALWELIHSYLHPDRGVSRTKKMAIEEFRLLMGVQEGEYTRFTDFRRRVLDVAVDDINAGTDLRVRYELEKQGRSYVTVQFFAFEAGRQLAFADLGFLDS